MPAKRKSSGLLKEASTANIGFEATLWLAADNRGQAETLDGGNVLTTTTLEHLPAHDGPKVVYAAGCRFSKARLERERITFKQNPYAIRTK